jgi:cytochrome oxidase Cu insertion factor (SCO1/SenC/PrrC family)
MSSPSTERLAIAVARRALGLLLAGNLAAACAPLRAGAEASAAAPSRSLFEHPWRWVDERSDDVVFSHFGGAPLVVTGFFASCTVRCPRTVEKLQRLDEAFRREGLAGQFFLVTLDPESDGVDTLRRFKERRHLGSSFHLLRGGREETREFGRMLGMRVVRDDAHLDHDVRIAVFDRGGRMTHTYDDWSFDESGAVLDAKR